MQSIVDTDTTPELSQGRAEDSMVDTSSSDESVSAAKPKWRRIVGTIVGSILLIAAVAAVLVAIVYVKGEQLRTAMSAPPPPEMPVAVRLATATLAEVKPDTTVVGTVLAPQRITLRNEESGTVVDVSMNPGGTVRQGDILLRMDIRVERAQLDAAKATLLRAKSTLKRAERLQLRKAMSEEEMEAAVAEAARSQAEVERLQAIIDRKQLLAPFDARVGLFQLHTGQYLDVGTNIVALEGIASFLNVDFAVPAHVADGLSVHDRVVMRTGTGKAPFTATVGAMDARSDPETRLLMVRANVQSPPKALVPGDSVLVTVPFGQAQKCLLIPRTAVRRGPSGDTVFVARQDPEDESIRAVAQMVRVVGSDESHSQIVSGLSAGDRVVADGSFKVFDGCLLSDVGGDHP